MRKLRADQTQHWVVQDALVRTVPTGNGNWDVYVTGWSNSSGYDHKGVWQEQKVVTFASRGGGVDDYLAGCLSRRNVHKDFVWRIMSVHRNQIAWQADLWADDVSLALKMLMADRSSVQHSSKNGKV